MPGAAEPSSPSAPSEWCRTPRTGAPPSPTPTGSISCALSRKGAYDVRNRYLSQMPARSSSRRDDTTTAAPRSRLASSVALSQRAASGSSPSHGSSRITSDSGWRPSSVRRPSSWRAPRGSARMRRGLGRHRLAGAEAAPGRRPGESWQRRLAGEVRGGRARERVARHASADADLAVGRAGRHRPGRGAARSCRRRWRRRRPAPGRRAGRTTRRGRPACAPCCTLRFRTASSSSVTATPRAACRRA